MVYCHESFWAHSRALCTKSLVCFWRGCEAVFPTNSTMDMTTFDNSMPVNCDLHLTHYEFFSPENGFRGTAIHETPNPNIHHDHDHDGHGINLDARALALSWMEKLRCQERRLCRQLLAGFTHNTYRLCYRRGIGLYMG